MRECFLIRLAVCTRRVIESRNLIEYSILVLNKSAFKIICSKKSMDNLLLDAIIGLNSKISQFGLLSLDITNS